ncbi:MAG TPA: hypothetical protein VHO25_14420, partial [Polyangiaceae bacterium]|nr:hypothetical protein [Polyangiaceae bacterium]
MNMAVLAIFQGDISKAQYEELRKVVRWETEQPAGALFHACSFDESGKLHVADVWESPELMGGFVEQRLMPAFQKLGLAAPEVSVYPVHNINAYKALSKYAI